MYRQPTPSHQITYLTDQSDYSLKIVCTTLNFFLFVLSIAIFAVGIWLAVWTTGFDNIGVIMNFDLHKASYILLIITGIFLIIISIVGMTGSQQESVPQLLAFVIVVLLSSLMLLAVAGLGIAFNQALNNNLATNFSLAITQIYGVNLNIARNAAVTSAIDQIQQSNACCGAIGTANSTSSWFLYQSSAWIQTINHSPPYVPVSCCVLNALNQPTNQNLCQGSTTVGSSPSPPVVNNGQPNAFLNLQGCVTVMVNNVNYFSLAVFGLGLGSFLYTIIILVLSCYLIRRIEVVRFNLKKDQYNSTAKLQTDSQLDLQINQNSMMTTALQRNRY